MKKIAIFLITIMLFSISIVPVSFAKNSDKPEKIKLKHSKDMSDLRGKVKKIHKDVVVNKDPKQYSQEEETQMKEIIEDLEILLLELEDRSSPLFKIQKASAEYTTPELARYTEIIMDLLEPNLTNEDIIAGFDASNIARDDAVQYAKDHNYYSNGTLITWDNEADAFRHFSWNYILSNGIGTSKTKIITDNHEFSYAAAKIYQNSNSSNIIFEAAEFALQAKIGCSQSESAFLNMFTDKPTFMDFINNGRGRYYAKTYSSLGHHEAFAKALREGMTIISLNQIDSIQKSVAYSIYSGSL
ncbi:DUF6973 domain-containing protein [Desulforamulus aeronauticus]|uniref:DUF6973 domain-containing protein n=1 Tax=Desulforamulus aeronauticus DSM 10349 TaxID=1121421 RepID=A0A1M6PIN3_9FIRM|nr:hypothetical protein [Desulforamulus aeronauticus]SHK07760.1 hypothetical protein SAMN02745123_00606 [Desulforamulus aeronauticus DSM 10349]